MGRSWPGMWVEDVQALISALGSRPIGLIGGGRFGKTALFAAATDERIAAVLAFLPQASWRVEARDGVLADIPGLLSVLDLPQALGLITPRACWLQFPPSVTEEQIQSTYALPHALQTRKGPDEQVLRLTRSEQPDWDQVAKWLQARLKMSGDRHR